MKRDNRAHFIVNIASIVPALIPLVAHRNASFVIFQHVSCPQLSVNAHVQGAMQDCVRWPWSLPGLAIPLDLASVPSKLHTLLQFSHLASFF